MRLKVILAFDPGETTGWCAMTEKGGVRGYGEFKDSTAVLKLLRRFHPTLVITERFVLYPHHAQDQIGSSFRAVEVIGVIKLECYRMRIPVRFRPAASRGFFKVEGRMAQYAPKVKGKHALDAARHLLTYLVFDAKTVPVQKDSPSE